MLRQVVDLSGRRDALVPNQAVRGCSSQELYGESYTPRSMARKKGYARKMKKIEPAVQTMTFSVNIPHNTTQEYYIDLSQCASLLNRRFYRQGINWAVSGIKFLSEPGTSGVPMNGTISVEKLPETWVMSNSWEKGFRAWQRMNNEALEEAESVRPRFLDFKIYADATHHLAGYGANLLPINGVSVATPGEWESSKIVLPLALGGTEGVTESAVVLGVGPSWPGVGASGFDAVSLIEGYASSRALPNIADPNLPDDLDKVTGTAPENWISAIFNDGTTQDRTVLDDMQMENNIAPYPFENDGVNLDTMYPNGANQISGMQIHDLEYVTGTTIGGTSRIKGGMFPCGLILLRLENRNQTPQEGSLSHTFTIDLVPGTHRGYLCEPMTEM